MWIEDNEEEILDPYKDAIVIKAKVTNRKRNRILVDSGSSVEMLFKFTLDEMRITDVRLEHTNASLKGFWERKLMTLKVIELPIIIGSRLFKKNITLDLVVVEKSSLYQMVLGRPFMRIIQLVISTHYLSLKYRVNEVIGAVTGDQRVLGVVML